MKTKPDHLNFDALKHLPGVRDCGSDLDHDPYYDPSVTLFLSNGYRVISEKTIYGQGLTITPFQAPASKDETEYVSLVKHSLPNPVVAVNTTPVFYQHRKQAKQNMTREQFDTVLHDIIGDEVLEFLAERHGFLAYRRT